MEKTKLLVIDDNKDLVEMIKEYFKKIPNIDVVLEAKDGKEGITLLSNKDSEYDMILLDLIMPNKDGIDVLEYINNNNIDKKVIVMTAYNTQDTIRRVASLGANYLMIKPFGLHDLEENYSFK